MNTPSNMLCANLKSEATAGEVGGCFSDDLNSILQAVQNLPKDERVEFDYAMEKAPNLVLNETDPLRFLRLESGNVQVAAIRLAHHWTQRREVFGDRYTLSLNLTGEGAMEPTDIENLKTGCFSILPSHSEAVTVVYFDISKVVHMGLDKTFRCLFYLAFQAWQKEKPVVLIRFSVSPVISRQKMLKLLGVYEAMSLTIDKVLCVYKPPSGTKNLFHQSIAPLVEGFVHEDKCNIKSVISDSTQDLLSELQSEGLSPDFLPSSVGGKLQLEDMSSQYCAQEQQHLAMSQKPEVETVPLESISCKSDDEMRAAVMDAAATFADEDRSAFDEAQAAVPEIVMSEMDPALVLRFEAGDTTAAARRLLAYWRKRKAIFSERFLRPLNLSGVGALSPDDIKALVSGCLTFLPSDSHGRQVFFIDSGRGNDLLSGEEGMLRRFRCIFYMLSNAVKNEKALLVLRLFGGEVWDQFHNADICEIMPVMPVAIDTVAMLCRLPIDAAPVFKRTLLPLMLESMSKVTTNAKSYVYSTPADFLPELVKLGCFANGLPTTVGGTWTYDHFSVWLQSQCNRDQHPSNVKESREAQGHAGLPHGTGGDLTLDAISALSSLASAANMKVQEERKDRKRKLDVMYARNRRQRERDEEEVLQKQCFDLSIANMALEEEEKRLLKLLSEVKDMVKELETSQGSVDALHSTASEQYPGMSSSLEHFAKSTVHNTSPNSRQLSEAKAFSRAKKSDSSQSNVANESAVVSALRQYQNRSRTTFATDASVSATLSTPSHFSHLYNAGQGSLLSLVPSSPGIFPGSTAAQLAPQPETSSLYATSNATHNLLGQNAFSHSAQLLSRNQDLLRLLPVAKSSLSHLGQGASEAERTQHALQQLLNTRLDYPPRTRGELSIPDAVASPTSGVLGNDIIAELLLAELLSSKVPGSGYGNGFLRR